MGELLSWHRVGRKVVCVDAAVSLFQARVCPDGANPLIEGAVYTITAVADDYPGLVALQVAGASLPEHVADLPYWRSTRFRPVRETSIESLRTLPSSTQGLVSEHKRERADA